MKYIFFILIFLSCNKVTETSTCDFDLVMNLYLVDSKKKMTLLDDSYGPFNSSSTITDEKGIDISFENLFGKKHFRFSLSKLGNYKLDTMINKTCLINLVPINETFIDIDTLKIQFKMKKDKCGGYAIEKLNCKYNDSLYVLDYLPSMGSEARFIKKGY